jgi:hypothetical protein
MSNSGGIACQRSSSKDVSMEAKDIVEICYQATTGEDIAN